MCIKHECKGCPHAVACGMAKPVDQKKELLMALKGKVCRV